jgi:hypothetical protein
MPIIQTRFKELQPEAILSCKLLLLYLTSSQKAVLTVAPQSSVKISKFAAYEVFHE